MSFEGGALLHVLPLPSVGVLSNSEMTGNPTVGMDWCSRDSAKAFKGQEGAEIRLPEYIPGVQSNQM